MSQHKKGFNGASMLGLILIALGIVWVLSNLGIIDFSVHNWWPIILIILGLLNLMGSKRINNPSAWFLIILGGIFLSTTNGYLEWQEIWKFWPIILVIIGISILFKKGGRIANTADIDRVNGSAIFGSYEKKVTHNSFRGGVISAVFGGAEVDLRSAQLHEDGAILELQATFGGVSIWIPESWALETRSNAILGGIENSTANKEKSEGKRLIIEASATFGGIEIRN